MPRLTGDEIEQLSRSLSRTLSRSDLEIYVHVSTGDQLYVEYVAEGLPLRITIFQLLEELENSGTTHLFLSKVYKERPLRPDVLETIQRLCPKAVGEEAEKAGLSMQRAGAQQAGAPDNAFAPGLQRNVRPHLSMADMGLWVARLSQIKQRVCRIEIGGAAAGTGFLVGPDAVLTNWHVIEAAKNADRLDRVRCRFDYVLKADASRDEGMIVRLHAADPCLDSSPYSPAEAGPTPDDPAPTENQLDYALLRLETETGRDTMDGGRRGWIELPDAAPLFDAGTPILIVQHPDGAPMKLAMDTQAIIGANANGTRLRYYTNTESGSSGSPCFTMDWDIVALHHFGDPAWNNPKFNQGVPIDRIRNSIAANGFGAVLGD